MTRYRHRWLLPAALILSLFVGLGKMELNGEEPRRAVVAMEMIESGNYVSPQLYGLPYYNKPPLHNWAIALSMNIFGKNEFGARVPSVISFILCGLLLFYWLKRSGQSEWAWWSMLFFFTAGDFLFYATMRSGEIDLFFSLIVMVNLICIYLALFSDKPKQWAWIAAYIALAAGILTKFYAIIPFHAIAVGLGLVLSSAKPRRIWSAYHLMGGLICAVLLLAYAVCYGQEVDLTRWWVNLFVETKHNAQKGGFMDRFEHLISAPFVVIKLLLPWSLLLVLLSYRSIRKQLKSQPKVLYMGLMVLVSFVLIWMFFRSRDRYFYPLIAPLSVIIGWLFLQAPKLYDRRRIVLTIMWVMVVMKLGLTYILYPKMDDGTLNKRYLVEEHSKMILELTEGEPLMIAAPRETFILHNDKLILQSHARQPRIPYQYPFYFGKITGVMPKYHDKTELQPDQWYLLHEDFIDDESQFEIALKFNEKWHGEPLTVARLKRSKD